MRRKDDRVLTRGAEIKGISEEDKQEIYENIDRVVENNRIPVTEELLTLKPKKKGAAFPVTINIIAIVAVAAAFFVSNTFFEQRREALSLETEQYLSTEGKLIEQLKKESEEKLKVKDEEIRKIQEELAELDQRSAELQANMENTIRRREAELRSELEQALEAERERLQEAGASTEDIESRLAEFEEERRREFEHQLENFREEAEAEIRAKEEELEQARALNRDFLARMNAEKAELEAELEEREEELSQQFEAEKAALEKETSEARQKLAELAAKSENERLFLDQLTSGYIGIKENLQKENYAAALEGAAALEKLLKDPSVTSLPGIAGRLEAERFILDTLKEDIESKTYKEDTDTASMVQAAETFLSAQEVARRGAAAMEAGNTTQAGEYYNRALASLPSIQRAHNDLATIRNEENARRLSAGISGAEELLAANNFTGAVERLKSAILSSETGNTELYERAVKGIENALTMQRRSAIREKDREIARLSEEQQKELENLENELNSRIAALEATIEELNIRISEQNETILSSEEAMTALEEEYQARIEELENRYRQELAEKEADYEERLEEKDKAYEERLAEKDAAYEELLAEKEAAAAEYEERRERLAAEIKAMGEEISGLRAVKTVYEELTADYLDYRSRIAGLLPADNREQARQAEELYTQFLGDEAETMFPGIVELSSDIDILRLRELEREATAEARKKAFEDVMLYTDYLSANLSGGDSGTRAEISKIAGEEPLYGDTILEIQQLVEAAGAETGVDETLFRQTRFIGTVSYIIENKIIIERLISFQADIGDTLLIKRKLASGRDETIAGASISRITDQKVEATITTNNGAVPEVMDLVYLVTN